MADERYTFETARIRLEEIAAEVRKKDTSLEKSLDLLEEGVRLANICTELVDHTDLSATVTREAPDGEDEAAGDGGVAAEQPGTPKADETAGGPVAGESPVEGDDAPSPADGDDAEAADASESSTDAGDAEEADPPLPLDPSAFDDSDEDLHEPSSTGSSD